jgi:hypothetical protein
MLFADDIDLVDETRHIVNIKLEVWQNVKVFLLSRTKTEYMECKFNKNRNKDEGTIKLDSHIIPKSVSF